MASIVRWSTVRIAPRKIDSTLTIIICKVSGCSNSPPSLRVHAGRCAQREPNQACQCRHSRLYASAYWARLCAFQQRNERHMKSPLRTIRIEQILSVTHASDGSIFIRIEAPTKDKSVGEFGFVMQQNRALILQSLLGPAIQTANQHRPQQTPTRQAVSARSVAVHPGQTKQDEVVIDFEIEKGLYFPICISALAFDDFSKSVAIAFATRSVMNSSLPN